VSEPLFANESPLGNLEVCVLVEESSPPRISFYVTARMFGAINDMLLDMLAETMSSAANGNSRELPRLGSQENIVAARSIRITTT